MQSEWKERLRHQVNDKLAEGSHWRESERGERVEDNTEGARRSGAGVENGGRVFQLQQLV